MHPRQRLRRIRSAIPPPHPPRYLTPPCPTVRASVPSPNATTVLTRPPQSQFRSSLYWRTPSQKSVRHLLALSLLLQHNHAVPQLHWSFESHPQGVSPIFCHARPNRPCRSSSSLIGLMRLVLLRRYSFLNARTPQKTPLQLQIIGLISRQRPTLPSQEAGPRRATKVAVTLVRNSPVMEYLLG